MATKKKATKVNISKEEKVKVSTQKNMKSKDATKPKVVASSNKKASTLKKDVKPNAKAIANKEDKKAIASSVSKVLPSVIQKKGKLSSIQGKVSKAVIKSTSKPSAPAKKEPAKKEPAKKAAPVKPSAPTKKEPAKKAAPAKPVAPAKKEPAKKAVPAKPAAPSKKEPAKKAAPAKPAAPSKKEPAKKVVPAKPVAPAKKEPAKKAAPAKPAAPAKKEPAKKTKVSGEKAKPAETISAPPTPKVAEVPKNLVLPPIVGASSQTSSATLKKPHRLTKGETRELKKMLENEYEQKKVLVRTLRKQSLERADEVNQIEDGSDANTRETELRQATQIESEMQAIRAALRRLSDGTYGICQCGNRIRLERLQANPSATLCIECAKKRDANISQN
ncbi:MAG: TraR/DksA family transcriptional regulator [Kiritimatiellae bacterium]|nr:TraR/DksA family transcriptional regulator [Kiritimatiellia bacterium]